MKKTTVYLPDELKRRLERTAQREDRSEAEVIRAALDAYTDGERPRPTLPLFASGDPTLAERVDDILAAGFGRE